MNLQIKHIFPIITALSLSLGNASAQVYLTSVDVFGAESNGSRSITDVWDTYAGDNNFKAWIQSGGVFLNGPSQSQVQPNIQLTTGVQSFTLYGAPGADYGNFGINLFFNGAINPSISAFGPMLTAVGPHSFAANSATYTPGIPDTINVPAAGTLAFVSGGMSITLTDFYWATPSVYNEDLTGQFSTGADGQNDYVGGFTLSVTPVPEPQLPLWITGILLGAAMIWRKAGQSAPFRAACR